MAVRRQEEDTTARGNQVGAGLPKRKSFTHMTYLPNTVPKWLFVQRVELANNELGGLA